MKQTLTKFSTINIRLDIRDNEQQHYKEHFFSLAITVTTECKIKSDAVLTTVFI